MNILITGGAGFIGSHTVVEFLSAGHTVTIVDNFCNSQKSVLQNIEKITQTPIHFVECNVLNQGDMERIMQENHIEAVVHFAALKAVGESLQQPVEYYENNVSGLISVLNAMKSSGVNQLIFSSSATVYGDPDSLPITESFPFKEATNPYGASKQMCERVITDTCNTGVIRSVLLRYFNPIGAHSSGLIGELPIGTPNNLVPFVAQTAAGIREKIMIFGDDYDTPDGTGVRDYIHVVDLAKAHVKAMAYLQSSSISCDVFNIGTGRGISVLELIQTFERVNQVTVPHETGSRRPGDIASCYASADKARDILGWQAEINLETALQDAWRWQQNINN